MSKQKAGEFIVAFENGAVIEARELHLSEKDNGWSLIVLPKVIINLCESLIWTVRIKPEPEIVPWDLLTLPKPYPIIRNVSISIPFEEFQIISSNADGVRVYWNTIKNITYKNLFHNYECYKGNNKWGKCGTEKTA